MPSILMTVPWLSAGTQRIYQAEDKFVRAEIHAIGIAGGWYALAFDKNTLDTLRSGDFAGAFLTLPNGSSTEIFMSPYQIIFAQRAGVSPTVFAERLSIVVSDALPLTGKPKLTASVPKPAAQKEEAFQAQAIGGIIQLSFNNEDWILLSPGPLYDIKAIGPSFYAMADRPNVKLTVLGQGSRGPYQHTVVLSTTAQQVPLMEAE